MKKITYLISCLTLSTILTTTLFAQPQPLTDRGMANTLRADFDSRNSTVPDIEVNWYNSDYGYYGTYSMGNQHYITRYDKDGNYIETFNKKDWTQNAPVVIKNSFNKSAFNNLKVVTYWEVTDSGRNGYYLELQDSNGKIINIWGDEKGRFSAVPYATNISN